MRNRLDHLFRNKLSDHAAVPSAQAWDRVRGGLTKKNNKPLLMRMAAAVLLAGMLTTTLLWLSSRDPISNASTSSSLGYKAEPKTNPSEPTNPSPQTVRAGKQKATAQRVPGKKKQTVETSHEKIQIIENQNSVAQSVIRTEEPPPQAVPSEMITTVSSSQNAGKPIVLVYRLEAIEPQAVEESPSVSEPKGNSGLLKVINFARDAKNGDGRLGDLRQAKDELFAFNFKKDKQNNHK